MIGRFTASQAAAAAPAAWPSARSFPVRRHSSSSGPNSSSGYSLVAAPSPNSTPASTGRRRAQASSPPAAKAVARASKLVKACTATSGEAATSAASQMRRPAESAVAHTVTSQAAARPTATMSK